MTVNCKNKYYILMPLYFQPMASFQDDDGCLNKKKSYARRYHRRKNGKM